MGGKVSIFMGSIIGIPILGLFGDPTNDLATGSAQLILAILAVIEGLALYKMFQLWRQDVRDQRKKDEARQEVLQQLIAENTAAQALSAESNKQFKEAVYHFATVIEKYNK